jgi:hypothetical protein
MYQVLCVSGLPHVALRPAGHVSVPWEETRPVSSSLAMQHTQHDLENAIRHIKEIEQPIADQRAR